MDALMTWLDGKKTYLTALVILICGVLAGFGITVPEYVWGALAAIGLGFLRVGVTKSGPADGVKLPFLVLGLGLPLVLMSGCNGMSNGQKYILTCQTVETTANTLASLDKAGAFGVADRARIKAMGTLAKTLILKMRDDLLSGKTSFEFPYLMTQLQTVLDELLRMQLAAEAAKTPKEITYGPRNTGDNWLDHGPEYSVASRQGDCGIPADRQSPDSGGNRPGDEGSGERPGQPGRTAWLAGKPIPLTALVEVEWD